MNRYHYVYVLCSEKDGKFYVGYTKNVQKRLEEHNSGQVRSTKERRPMKLIYWEGCISKQDAARREKYLKTAWGKRYIKGRVKDYLTGEQRVFCISDLHLKKGGFFYLDYIIKCAIK